LPTVVTVTLGLISAIRRNIQSHLGNMIGSYIGIAVAFVFAITVPGRAIPQLLAEDAPTGVYVAGLVVVSVVVIFVSLKRGGRTRGPAGSRSAAVLAAGRGGEHADPTAPGDPAEVADPAELAEPPQRSEMEWAELAALGGRAELEAQREGQPTAGRATP
jgi:hypothetical protein